MSFFSRRVLYPKIAHNLVILFEENLFVTNFISCRITEKDCGTILLIELITEMLNTLESEEMAVSDKINFS